MRVRRSVWLLGAVLCAACATSQKAQLPAATDPSSDCGMVIPGLDALVKPGAVVIVGETHGTQDPAVAERFACVAASKGLALRVETELRSDSQPHMDSFMAASDEATARAELFEGREWTDAFQDGRTSHAMYAFLDKLRELRAAGHAIQLYGLQGFGSDPDYDQRMADGFLAIARQPFTGFTLLYCGMTHAAVAPIPMDHLDPTGHRLRKAGVTLTSLVAAHAPGTVWMCTGGNAAGCQTIPLPGHDEGNAPFVELAPISHGLWDGKIYVGKSEASPPVAVAVAPERLVVDPNSPGALRVDANAAYDRGDFLGCATKLARVMTSSDARPEDAYNSGTCYARAHDKDAAFSMLERAISLGMKAGADWASDSDLVSLHDDQRWPKLFEQATSTSPGPKPN